MVIPVGVDTAKELIYARLEIEDPGPGYMHFSQACNEEYFNQLTAERHITKYSRGFPTKVWVKKPGQRNEALDTEVYALVAYKVLSVNMESLSKDLRRSATATDDEETRPKRKLPGRNPITGYRRGRNWVDGWKDW